VSNLGVYKGLSWRPKEISMKTYTSKDLNDKRLEIKDTLAKDGECILQFKRSDRSIDLEVKMTCLSR